MGAQHFWYSSYWMYYFIWQKVSIIVERSTVFADLDVGRVKNTKKQERTENSAEVESDMEDLLRRCLDAMRSNIGLVVYFIIWCVLVGGFWFMKSGPNAIDYAVIAFYFVLPVTSFVIAIVYGMREDTLKFYLPFLFGVMEILSGFFSFQLANIIANGEWNTWNTPDLEMGLYSFIPALLGLLIGLLVRLVRKKIAAKR